MAHPLLLSLTNINPDIRSKGSLHAHVLLALLPVISFIHKKTRVRSLLSDRLVHECLDFVLKPLKVAATVGIMMSDPIGNLRYCFTPLVAYIADTPKQTLLSCVNAKAPLVSTATYKEFGDPFAHPPRTLTTTLEAINKACSKADPMDFESFLKIAKRYFLNGVHIPFWKGWLLTNPSKFLPPDALHHFHRFSWDHNLQWSIFAVRVDEIDYRFSLVQTAVGYRSFEEGVSKLKQVTGRDHHAVQRYIIGVVAGAVPPKFLVAIRALLNFCYPAQMPCFDQDDLVRVETALQTFHDNKSAIITSGARRGSNGPLEHWEIPKLELLQHVVMSIHTSGAVMQWTTDIMEHAHITKIKQPARAGNNQDYYSQIAQYLDHSEKCLRFDLATHIVCAEQQGSDEDDEDQEDEHELDSETLRISQYYTPTGKSTNYFKAVKALANSAVPNTTLPHRIFSSSTTVFCLAGKPSLWMTIGEAAEKFGLPNLQLAIANYLCHADCSPGRHVEAPSSSDRIQIWVKVQVQLPSYHN